MSGSRRIYSCTEVRIQADWWNSANKLQKWADAWRISIGHVQVYGVIGKPVAHSRSPALHNTAMHAAGLDAVYVPLLVDELPPFLEAFPDFSGFSVTIPHKVYPP